MQTVVHTHTNTNWFNGGIPCKFVLASCPTYPAWCLMKSFHVTGCPFYDNYLPLGVT